MNLSSTRARACLLAGLVAGLVTTSAALTYEAPAGAGEPPARASTAAPVDRSGAGAAPAPAPGALPPDRVSELAAIAVAAIPGVLPRAGRVDPRPPRKAEVAARTQQVAAAASRGGGRSGVGLAVWPAGGALSGTFGEPRDRHRHAGVDLDAGRGAPVVAAGGGVVVVAGPAPAAYAGYGTIVLIDHGGGLQTLSAHLSSVSVGVGQTVGPGDRVGSVGSSGAVTGPHLHFEVRLGGTPVDPLAWLPSR